MDTIDLGFVLGLAGIALIVILPLVYFGLKLSRKLESYTEENESELADIYVRRKLTFSGSILYGCLGGFLLSVVVMRGVFPTSSFGSFVSSFDGLGILTIASIFLFVIAAKILRRIGYPIMSRDE